MQKLSPTLLGDFFKNKKKKYSAIVLFKEQADLSGADQIADRTERVKFVYERLTEVAKKYENALPSIRGLKDVTAQQFYIVNMMAVFNVNKADLQKLAERGDIDKIIYNPEFKALPPILKDKLGLRGLNLPAVGENISSIGADRVWKDFATKGEGIVVAGQDTGVQWDHPALKNQYRGFDGQNVDHTYNWHDAIKKPVKGSGRNNNAKNKCGYNLKAPCDDNAHGTHTMGTVVGSDGNAHQIGVAPGAQWIACRNMDAGLGRPSTYIDCFEYFLAPYPHNGNPLTDGAPEKAPHVINNSWGCPAEEGCHDAEILPVLKVLKAAGIFVVASAGNEGPGCSTIAAPPAMHSDTTLSVGAHDHRNGKIASFSSRGPSKYDGGVGPDISAPGVKIESAVPGGGYSGSMWSGTSMAGPHVVGQVALMWSANPKLIGKFDATTELIEVSATPTKSTQNCGGVAGANIPNNVFGYGRINAYEAVKAAKKF